MAHSPDVLRLAQAHLQEGRFPEAEGLFRELLGEQPEHLEALDGLGVALAGQGRFDAAVACFGRVLGFRQDHGPARAHLAAALRGFAAVLAGQGQAAQATACLEGALQVAPLETETRLRLGVLFQALGRRGEAVAQFEHVVAEWPECLEALVALGTLHAQVGQAGPASKWYRWALALDPTLEEANFNLAALLEGEARLNEAQLYRSRVSRPLPLALEAAPEPCLRVLLPWAAGSGNVPVDNLLPRATTTRIKWFVELATDEQEAALPPWDVVFNGIGNADLAGPSLERLTRFHARHPMLNPPDRVLKTRRDLMPDLLADLPGVLVPKVARLRRDEVLDELLLPRLEAQGLRLPLLVRPTCTQGGHGALRVETLEQLREATASDADAFYFIAFHDTREADGHYRKYRVIFVDRQPYPYHLAISSDWLVHYQSARMLSAPEKREEERRFLEDPWTVLGPGATAALEAIGRRLDLDYAGIDFTLKDGQVLVFEANATMLAHLDDAEADYPYKHRVVPEIFRAFQAMLERHRA